VATHRSFAERNDLSLSRDEGGDDVVLALETKLADAVEALA